MGGDASNYIVGNSIHSSPLSGHHTIQPSVRSYDSIFTFGDDDNII